MALVEKRKSKKVPLITIAIPVYNEEDNILALYERLSKLAASMSDRCKMEFLFSDNHSKDSTWSILGVLAEKDKRIRAIRFSKNFGFQRSILANFIHARGDAVLQVDADLQDPPELLRKFFDLWKTGYRVVYGIRSKRKEGPLMSAIRRLGYWAIDKISEDSLPRDAGDFRLIDREIIKVLSKFKITEPYLRGLIASLGFSQIGVPYERIERIAGKSKFPMKKVLQLGFAGVFSQSRLPLKFASYAGVSFIVVSIIGAIYYTLVKFLIPGIPQGMASLHILVLFGIGFQSLLIGIIGEYLMRVYVSTRGDPIAIIEDCLNIDSSELRL